MFTVQVGSDKKGWFINEARDLNEVKDIAYRLGENGDTVKIYTVTSEPMGPEYFSDPSKFRKLIIEDKPENYEPNQQRFHGEYDVIEYAG